MPINALSTLAPGGCLEPGKRLLLQVIRETTPPDCHQGWARRSVTFQVNAGADGTTLSSMVSEESVRSTALFRLSNVESDR